MSETWTTNPATGQLWTVADVNLQAGVEKSTGADAASTVRVTQVYVTFVIRNDATYEDGDGPTGGGKLDL